MEIVSETEASKRKIDIFTFKPMTILLKIQKTLQMNSIFFVNVTSKFKEQIKTSNCDILRQFCNEKSN